MSKRLAVAAGAALLTCCLAAPAIADDVRAAHVVVEGPYNEVYQFHGNLKALMAAMVAESDLATAGVACSVLIGGSDKDCEELGRNPQSNAALTAEYVIFRDLTRLTAFVAAWAKLQETGVSAVRVTFDMSEISTPDCTDPEMATQPCTNAPYCSSTRPRRCDKVYGPPCTSCGVP